jgi:hypothetical protein
MRIGRAPLRRRWSASLRIDERGEGPAELGGAGGGRLDDELLVVIVKQAGTATLAARGPLGSVAEGETVDECHTAPGLVLGGRAARHGQDVRTVVDLDQDPAPAEVGAHRDGEHRAGAVPHRVGDQFRDDRGQCRVGGFVQAQPPILGHIAQTTAAERHRGRIADQKEALAVHAHGEDPSTDFRPWLEA